ncbi:MAG: tetratricopeptide repeat protein [Polyangiaceae bacterium]|nr:tetratricopeptide repeat protein [Polyangiaceae bacterium]MCB9605213.1 tetratricopeptide repeat protein [Polyangiaceae bacterium]
MRGEAFSPPAATLLALSALLTLGACAPSFSDAFERERAAAIRTYGAGRYVEAAQHWEQVAKEAPDKHQRYEALYRAAVSYKRGKRGSEARRLYQRILKEAPDTSRAPRAAYDLADLDIEGGKDAAGFKAMEQVIERYPDASTGPSALNRYLVWLEDQQGEAAAKAWLESRIPRQEGTELGQYLHYAYAKLLLSMGDKRGALARYLLVADKYPYPKGALWDDSLFHAAELEQELGNPQGAVKHLKRMLKEREPSSLSGSYERPRYSESQYKLALLYRDALHQPEDAIREFERLRKDFTTSILRDDAAWQEAKLRVQRNDTSGACRAMRWLRDEIPDSRYSACGQLLCSELKPLDRECRDYIQRELRPAAEELDDASEAP